MITVIYDDTMCNGPYRVEHKTMEDAVESVNNDFESLMKELRDEGYEPEWIRDGHHMLEVYVPNTSINAWWDFEYGELKMDTNEIKMFEQKMIDSAFIDAVDYDPKVAARAVGARKMKMKGVCSFNEYISYLQTITGNAKLFWKYQF